MLLSSTKPLPPASVMVLVQVGTAFAAPLFTIVPRSNAAPKLMADPIVRLCIACFSMIRISAWQADRRANLCVKKVLSRRIGKHLCIVFQSIGMYGCVAVACHRGVIVPPREASIGRRFPRQTQAITWVYPMMRRDWPSLPRSFGSQHRRRLPEMAFGTNKAAPPQLRVADA